MSRQGDLQDYQNWVDNFYSVVGKMPQTTFGDWQNRGVVMADLLELQRAEDTEAPGLSEEEAWAWIEDVEGREYQDEEPNAN